MADIPSSGPVGDMPFADIFDMGAPPRPEIPGGPVIVTIARDEMLRLPDYLRHHRAIGIRHFLIVDNGSTDRTAEVARSPFSLRARPICLHAAAACHEPPSATGPSTRRASS